MPADCPAQWIFVLDSAFSHMANGHYMLLDPATDPAQYLDMVDAGLVSAFAQSPSRSEFLCRGNALQPRRAQLPADYQPYSEAEVRALRRMPDDDINARRERLLQALHTLKHAPGATP